MTHPIFWVCLDYGQGDPWALVRAESADRIRARFPRFKVFEAGPRILDEETKARIGESSVYDLESAPSEWSTDLGSHAARTISSAAEFQAILERIQRRLRSGTLQQCDSCHPDSRGVEVSELPLAGPWPDLVAADFIDARGRQYRLFVDCYHGTGSWHDPTEY